MNNIFFTSDIHFGHDKNFLYSPRGFENIHDHDEQIIKNWNSVVSPTDTVYILGDIMLNDNSKGIENLRRLAGHKYIIIGNHDTDSRIELYKNVWDVEVLGYAWRQKFDGYNFFLSYYPTLVSNYDDDKKPRMVTLNLCGHTHTQDRFLHFTKDMLSYHCDMDAHQNMPVSLEEVAADIRTKYAKLKG